jgi:hypothetical protein
MRTLFAGLFVFTMMLAVVSLIGSHYPAPAWPWWAVPLIMLVMAGSVIASLFLFNKRGFRPALPGQSAEEHIDELQRQGLLTAESFSARRAFQVEEFEVEGSHYFIELADRAVLYLTGQYLYDYEQITDDPALNQPRQFPCSQFTVRRHKTEGYVVDIACAGEALTPECVAPPFNRGDVDQGLIPEDGQIFRDRSYEQLKRERLHHG